jgi:hypothetical protein
MILAYSTAVHEGRIEPLIGMPLRPRVCRFQSSHGKGQTVSRLFRTKSIDNMVDESEHGANRLRRTRFLISSSIVRLYSVFGGVAGTSAVTCGEGARGSLDFASTALSLASTRSSCSRRLISCAFSWSISDSCAEAAVQVENSKNAKATVSRMTVLRGMTKNATRADTREHPHVDTLGLGSKGTSSGWMLVAED